MISWKNSWFQSSGLFLKEVLYLDRELRETIAIFFGNIIRDKTNSVFPCFSPKKSVFSGHEWLRFECRAKRDNLEAMNDRNTLTLQGGKTVENRSGPK